MMRQPVRQAGLHRRRVQGLGRQRGAVAAGGDRQGAAAHQELVHGEDGLVVQVRGIHHHQHVRRGRGDAVVQVGAFDVEVRAQHLAQALELVARRLLHLHLLLHVGRRRLRRGQRDGLQQPDGKTLQAFLDAAPQTVLVQRLRQRQLKHGLAVGQSEVEVEGVGVEQAGGHGPKAVVGADLRRHFASAGVRVHGLGAQLAVGLLDHFGEQRVELPAQRDQRLGQPFVGGEVAGELHRAGQVVEDAAAALESVQHLLDGAGDVVLWILQLHVQVVLALHFDFDQIAKAQHFVLVAVLHQHVEVGVDQACLVAVGHLERHRTNAVLGVGFVFEFRVRGGVDQLQAHLAGAGHFVLRQQVLQLRRQRRQQRMRLGAEVAAQQQRFAQLAQVVPGGVRDGVLVAFGDVPAQKAHRRQPEVGDQHVGGHQAQQHALAAMPRRVAVRRPAVGVHGVDVERQKDGEHRDVEVQIAQVKHAPRNGPEARTRAQRAQRVGHLVAGQFGEERAADQIERAAAEGGEDQGDDLVVRLGADEQADADVGGAQQTSGQIAGEHRPPVQVPQHGDGDRQRQRQGQRHRQQQPAGEKLAEHEVDASGRHGDHQFQGADAAFVAPAAHRQRRSKEDQQHRQPLEHGPHVGDVAGEECLAPEEDEQRHCQESGQEQIGDGRGEDQRQFLAGDAQHHAGVHADASSAAAAGASSTSRNTVSRSLFSAARP